MKLLHILQEYLNNSQVNLRRRMYYDVYRILKLPNITFGVPTKGELLGYAQRMDEKELIQRLKKLCSTRAAAMKNLILSIGIVSLVLGST